jgi:serine/threonine-protein kinase
MMERLTRSQKTVADLAQPELIPFEDIGLAHGHLYLVRSHVESQTLAGLLHHAGSLDSDATVEIAIHLCEALEVAHRAKLVHGGLSPHCVLVGDDGRILVTDTGVLPALRPISVPPGHPWGRFPYLSPEQAAGRDLRPASDVYTIGLLLYEMLSGWLPFCADNESCLAMEHLNQAPAPLLTLVPQASPCLARIVDKILAMEHLNQAPAPLQTLVPQVSPRLARIVDKILTKEPAARYRDAGQVAHILHSQVARQTASQLASGALLVIPPPPAPRAAQGYQSTEVDIRSEEPAGTDWLMVSLIIAALVAVLGLIPVWRIVYRRYDADNLPYGGGASTVPSSATMPFLYHLPEEEAWLCRSHIEGQGSQATERTEVSGFTVSGMGVRFKATFRQRPSPSGAPVLQSAYLWVGRSGASSFPRGTARCPGAEVQIGERNFPSSGV